MTTISYDPTTGRYYEYTPHGRIPIPGQRLARLAPTATPQGARARRGVFVGVGADTSGAVLAGVFWAALGGTLAALWLIKELIG